uniref:Protein tyrosine phosphatase n=1 Tax=Glyptapanteles indiensis TaxID=92994 RepID=B7S8T5_GLYIN|nr:protein tyrosine phosphatase [Glyptapanteles indiensis]
MNTTSVQNWQNGSTNQRRKSMIENINIDPSASFVDSKDIKKKFMLIGTSDSNLSSSKFWNLAWKSDTRVIVRFDKGKSMNHPWLSSSSSLEYNIGEFTVWKKTMIDKYYTQINLTIRNNKEKKSRKITHFQYHDCLDHHTPFYSVQLISFWKMVNKKHGGYITIQAEGKKNALSPIVMYSDQCFERLVSICAIDIYLDQLMKEQPVSVTTILLGIKSQVSLSSISPEEEAFIDRTLLHSERALFWKKKASDDRDPESKTFGDRVKKYCSLFKRTSVF